MGLDNAAIIGLFIVTFGFWVWLALPPKDEWSYKGSSDRKISDDLSHIKARIKAMRVLENMKEKE